MSLRGAHQPKVSGFLLRLSVILTTLLLLGACAVSPSQNHSINVSADANIESLTVFDRLIGTYASTKPTGWQLTIEPLPETNAFKRRYALTQSQPAGADRVFFLSVAREGQALTGSFTAQPLITDANPRACQMTWQWATGTSGAKVLLGSTSLDSCQFEGEGQQLGLIKELAFDGQTLRFADQLFEIESGRPYLETQTTDFQRVQRFSASVARLDGDQWRVAAVTNLPSDGQRRAVEDAAGMSLGIAVSVEPRILHDQLHWLAVISDPQNTDVLGQVWATDNSQTFGWAGLDLQVEFRRLP